MDNYFSRQKKQKKKQRHSECKKINLKFIVDLHEKNKVRGKGAKEKLREEKDKWDLPMDKINEEEVLEGEKKKRKNGRKRKKKNPGKQKGNEKKENEKDKRERNKKRRGKNRENLKEKRDKKKTEKQKNRKGQLLRIL